MNEFICPFCKQPMRNMSNTMLICHRDNLFASLTDRKCEFSASAPKHLRESFRFINTFRKVRPTFVFSPKKLWEEGFSEDNVKYVACRHPMETVVDYKLSSISRLGDLKDVHLIGGAGLLADELRPYVTNAIAMKAKTSPLDMLEFPDASQWLWTKILLNTVKTEISSSLWKAVGAYFALCPEHILSYMDGDIQFGINTIPYTNEMMLYSHIVISPALNVPWGVGSEEIITNCRNYVKYLTRGLKSVNDKPDGYNLSRLPKTMQNEKLFLQMYDTFLGAHPSLAVNMQNGEVVSYDILDNEFKVDVTEGLNEPVTQNAVMEKFRVNLALETLYKKYASPYLTSFSLKEKANFCRLNGVFVNPDNYDEVVIKFWEIIRDKFEEETVSED